MENLSLNLMIGGDAGQGLVTIGDLLTRTLVRQGYHIVVTQDYQSRIRGGHNTFSIRVSPAPIAAPGEEIDLLVALNQETIRLHQKDLAPCAVIISDEKFNL
ncbi:MAG: 2-oxoacid:acceptor oxidoreductase family protein, partial [Syntrophales bacterium LBB04]|nr:2-oxoacid:acceptor oxidoreductase family protein [Syntrophales bacterium LBB04]